MNDNYTHIVVLVDGSGSMEPTKTATIEGVNNFIASQKTTPSVASAINLSFEPDLSDSDIHTKCTITLAWFQARARGLAGYGITSFSLANSPSENDGQPEDYNYFEVCKNADILTASGLTPENYRPDNGTPLVDATYRAITDCARWISRLPEAERPGRIIFVSMTDGVENASKIRTREQLKKITEEKVALNWQFIYLGANQDSYEESNSYGYAKGQALNYSQDSAGICRGFDALANNVLMKRSVAKESMTSCSISSFQDKVMPAPTSTTGTTGASWGATDSINGSGRSLGNSTSLVSDMHTTNLSLYSAKEMQAMTAQGVLPEYDNWGGHGQLTGLTKTINDKLDEAGKIN